MGICDYAEIEENEDTIATDRGYFLKHQNSIDQRLQISGNCGEKWSLNPDAIQRTGQVQ